MMRALSFEGSCGAELAGWLHVPQEKPRGALVFAHCFTCSKDLHLVHRLARGLEAQGFYLLRFDFTGVGQSKGSFTETTLDTNVQDLHLAAEALARQAGELPLGLIGHSLGGTAVLLAAADLPAASALAVIAASVDPTSMGRRLGLALEGRAQPQGAVPVSIAGRTFHITPSLLRSLARPDLLQRVEKLGRPLLLLHGTGDTLVEIHNSEQIFSAARQPKGFEPLWGADHLLTRPQDADWAARILGLWFERHLDPTSPPPPAH